MAKYGVLIHPPSHLRRQTRQFITFLRNRAEQRGLEFSFELRTTGQGQLHCYIGFRGSLGALQNLERQIGNNLLQFLEMITRPEEVLSEVIAPFLKFNRTGVAEVTKAFDMLLGQLREARLSKALKTSPLTAGHKVRRIALQRRPRSREARCVRAIVSTIDQYASHGLPAVATVILCDQAMEELLKVTAAFPKTSRKGFNEALDAARSTGHVNGTEAYRLLRFHRMRNRVQHRGGKVRRSTVEAMLDFYLQFLNRGLGVATA